MSIKHWLIRVQWESPQETLPEPTWVRSQGPEAPDEDSLLHALAYFHVSRRLPYAARFYMRLLPNGDHPPPPDNAYVSGEHTMWVLKAPPSG